MHQTLHRTGVVCLLYSTHQTRTQCPECVQCGVSSDHLRCALQHRTLLEHPVACVRWSRAFGSSLRTSSVGTGCVRCQLKRIRCPRVCDINPSLCAFFSLRFLFAGRIHRTWPNPNLPKTVSAVVIASPSGDHFLLQAQDLFPVPYSSPLRPLESFPCADLGFGVSSLYPTLHVFVFMREQI